MGRCSGSRQQLCYLSYTVAGGVVSECYGGLGDSERHQLFRCNFIGHQRITYLEPHRFATLSNYVKTALEDRKSIIKRLVQSAASKVTVSVDVWTSSNYLSFLGVVAHFVGR